MNKENKVLLNIIQLEKNDIMSFVGKSTKLEIIMLSELSQSQKTKLSHVLIHFWNLDLK
jgi:hypothetical protein